jgi:hypothetical protein
MITIRSSIRSLYLLAAATFIAVPLLAADKSPEIVDDTHAYFEVLRSQFNSEKVATLNRILKLTADEADKFWPIYREYEKEFAAVGDRKLQLIREFFKDYGRNGLTDESASALAEKWFKNLQDRTDLWKKYHAKLSRELSPVRAAQFLQVEHQMALLVDLSLASDMPALAPNP